MTLPRTRLTITAAESALATPGLVVMASRLKLMATGGGYFPDRYAGAEGWLRPAHIYRERSFNAALADRLIELGSLIAGLTEPRRFRLDCIDLAMIALALRLPKRGLAEGSVRLKCEAFCRKLENHRKRAKRVALRDRELADYWRAAARWNRFRAWLRYNVVDQSLPKRNAWSPRRTAAEARLGLQSLISEALEAGEFAPLLPHEMERMVRLIKEEFRRGRHPVCLRDLLTGGRTFAQELVVKILRKKMQLTPLSDKGRTVSERSAERGERFKAAARSRGNAAAQGRPPHVEPKSAGGVVAVVQPSPTFSLASFSVADLSRAVANWLRTEVPVECWVEMPRECQVRLHAWRTLPRPRGTATIEATIRKFKPVQEEQVWSFDEVNFYAEWLFCWIRTVCPDSNGLLNSVHLGVQLATQASVDDGGAALPQTA